MISVSLAGLSRERLKRQGNPRYACARARQLVYERRHPTAPWLTPQATGLLATMLRPVDRGVEFGAGRSTLWFAARVEHLTSVEQDEYWHTLVAGRLAQAQVTNVDLVLAPFDEPEHCGERSGYVRVLERFAPASLDFALVDGAYRAQAARLAMTRLRPGGLMIIDNVNWYLPSRTKAPASRAIADGPAALWTSIAADLARWRLIWTSSGVWDTAIFIRP